MVQSPKWWIAHQFVSSNIIFFLSKWTLTVWLLRLSILGFKPKKDFSETEQCFFVLSRIFPPAWGPVGGGGGSRAGARTCSTEVNTYTSYKSDLNNVKLATSSHKIRQMAHTQSLIRKRECPLWYFQGREQVLCKTELWPKKINKVDTDTWYKVIR